MRRIFSFFIILIVAHHGNAQIESANSINTSLTKGEKIKDSLVTADLDSFRLHGRTIDSKLFTELPLLKCDSHYAYFSKGSTYIHLYFKKDLENNAGNEVNALDSMFVVLHSHYWVNVPRSAYTDITQTYTCNFNSPKRKAKISSPYYKAFVSKDKKRMYVYLLGGRENRNYEAIWIFKDGQYLTRTYDPVE